MYKYSVFNFTSKEIDTICQLVKTYSHASNKPLDGRTLTKQVKEYGLHFGLLEKKDGRIYVSQNSSFNMRYALPVEALYRLIQPMIEQNTGYAIVNDKRWSDLNIYPQKSRGASEKDLQEKEELLLWLDVTGYITFQCNGTLWNIYTK